NTGSSPAWAVRVDRTGPTASADIQLAGFDPASGDGVVSWPDASDPPLPDGTPGSGVAGYELRYSVNQGGFSAWADATSGGSVSGLVAGGTLDVELRAYDAVGNRGSSVSATIPIPSGSVEGDTALNPDGLDTAADDPDAEAPLPLGPGDDGWLTPLISTAAASALAAPVADDGGADRV